jgi:hypothetical protein
MHSSVSQSCISQISMIRIPVTVAQVTFRSPHMFISEIPARFHYRDPKCHLVSQGRNPARKNPENATTLCVLGPPLPTRRPASRSLRQRYLHRWRYRIFSVWKKWKLSPCIGAFLYKMKLKCRSRQGSIAFTIWCLLGLEPWNHGFESHSQHG